VHFFPLAGTRALNKLGSDHTPIVIDTGDSMASIKKRLKFEKWWLEREDFREIVDKVWSMPCRGREGDLFNKEER
jgi:hypothetical protein